MKRNALLLLVFLPLKLFAEPTALCRGANELLLLADRPTISASPCTMPIKQVAFEQGYQGEKLVYKGQAHHFPSLEYRQGLPANTELHALLPDYTFQTIKPSSGFGPVAIGLKHIMHYTDRWIFTIDSALTPPSGGINFGSQGVAAEISGIFSYKFSDLVSVTGQLLLSTQTESVQNGGRRFNSVNPDVFLTWSLTDKLQFYHEVYGQSKTDVNEGWGCNIAAGFVYLPIKNMTLDIEAGQRLSGLIGRVENYVAAGGVIQF